MADTPNPYRLAHDGYGYQDLMAKCGLSESEARYIVFGWDAYKRWRDRQKERKAS